MLCKHFWQLPPSSSSVLSHLTKDVFLLMICGDWCMVEFQFWTITVTNLSNPATQQDDILRLLWCLLRAAVAQEVRAPCPLIGRSVVWIPATPVHMSACPWARNLTLNCSRRLCHWCVNEWVNVTCLVKCSDWSEDQKSAAHALHSGDPS